MSWDTSDADAKDAELAAAMADMSPAMRRGQDLFSERIRENFKSESAAGDGFAPLAESTIRDRASKGFGPAPILRRTGDMESAATEHREHSADHFEVGVQEGHPYAKYHPNEDRTHGVQRDFLAIDDRTIEQVEEEILEHIDRAGG